jgi:tRNA(Ile)-lysidine synthase
MDFLERVAAFIQANQLLQPGQPLVAAVSGGPDSVCLLDCLVQLGYRPLPVYVDHGLRSESADEGRFVSRLAETYDLKAIVRSIDVPRLLEEQGGSLEEVARQARYDELFGIAHEENLDTIATAHQVDDQIETVLLHFLRGSGVAGLRGMKPSTDLAGWFKSPHALGKRLVRPLLNVERQQVMDYLARRNLDFQTDVTNVDLEYRRNRVRHELIPQLQTYNPAIRTSLLRLSRIMAEQSAWVEGRVADYWGSVVVSDDPDQLVLDPEALGQLPAALQKELLRSILSRLQFANLELDYGIIEASVAFCHTDARRMTLAGGVKLERVDDRVIIACEGAGLRLPQYPQMMSDTNQPIPVPGEVPLANGWKLSALVENITDEDRQHWGRNQNEFRVAFDREALPDRLALRVRHEGDRIKPLGLQGTIKLSDLFINDGIPQSARHLWPIVAHGDEVIWVVGLRMADSGRLTETTTEAVVMQVEGPVVS